MPNSEISLLSVGESIRGKIKLIAGITIAAAIAGIIFHMAGPKKYDARTEFLVRNPLYSDRSSLYDGKQIDYFANEDDVNRVILMAGSYLVQHKVIADMQLAAAYNIDTATRKGQAQMERRFEKNLAIMRTEYHDLVLDYTDTDPERAAAVANHCTDVLEQVYNGYYRDMRQGMYRSIMDKVREEDSTIAVLTDTLAKLRDQYGIYDIISPTRHNIMMGNMGKNGSAGYGRGLEVVQNIESVKDEIVSDRALKITLASQYMTGNRAEQLPLIKVITTARPPVSPKGLSGLMTVVACALLGFFFAVLLVLISDNVFGRPAAAGGQ